jgi:hypothetical protein
MLETTMDQELKHVGLRVVFFPIYKNDQLNYYAHLQLFFYKYFLNKIPLTY